MSLNRMFDTVEDLRSVTSVDAAFGEPREVEGKVLIPVAAVGRGFGLGFSQSASGDRTEGGTTPADRGAGSLGRARVRPVAMIEVTAHDTTVKPIVDETKIALAGLALGAWTAFCLMATVRSVFGQHHAY
jgi:uncharacterized spore protein YtfJ